MNYEVDAIAISGSDVYVGGQFTLAGQVNVNHVASWDGSQWYPLGSGVSGGGLYEGVYAIGIIGNDAYVGGVFDTAGGVSANNVARWDSLSSQWYPLGSGVRGGTIPVYGIAV